MRWTNDVVGLLSPALTSPVVASSPSSAFPESHPSRAVAALFRHCSCCPSSDDPKTRLFDDGGGRPLNDSNDGSVRRGGRPTVQRFERRGRSTGGRPPLQQFRPSPSDNNDGAVRREGRPPVQRLGPSRTRGAATVNNNQPAHRRARHKYWSVASERKGDWGSRWHTQALAGRNARSLTTWRFDGRDEVQHRDQTKLIHRRGE